MSNESTRKIDWNVVLTAISVACATISVVVAVIASRQSAQSLQLAEEANSIAQEANQLAQKSQLAQMTVRHTRGFPNYNTFGKPLCRLSNGDLMWDNDFIIVIDISNLGGKATTLTDIDDDNVTTNNPYISMSVLYEKINSKDRLEEWLQLNVPGHDPTQIGVTKLFTDTLNYSGLPFTIEPGTTERIVLQGYDYLKVDRSLQLSQLYDALVGKPWTSQLNFSFGDGSTVPLTLPVSGPYLWQDLTQTPISDCPL